MQQTGQFLFKLFSLSSKVPAAAVQDPRTPCPVVSVLPEALLCSGLAMGGTDKHSRFTSVHQDTALRDVRECKERPVKPPLS